MEDYEDMERLRTDPKEWERVDVWQKLWGSATMAARRKLAIANSGDVEDIAIQSIKTVMEELSNRPEIRKFGELRAFTTSVAYHLAISHLRQVLSSKHGGGKVGRLEENVDQLLDDRQISPADHLQIKERTLLVIRVLDKLKSQNRILLYDFFLNGMKQKEIAAKYDMPIGTVGVYIQRALKEVKTCLNNDAHLLEDIRSTVGLTVLMLILLAI